jgi:putative peptide zinc metalloprotease protein
VRQGQPPHTAAAPGGTSARAVTQRELDACTVIDTSERRPVYLLTRQNGAYVRLSPSAYQLLRLRVAGVSSEEIAHRLESQGAARVNPEQLEVAYQAMLESIRRIEDEFRPTFFGLWIKRRLMSQTLVARIGGRLSVLYRGVAPALLLSIVAIAAWRATSYSYALDPTGMDFWVAYLLLALSLLVHEFGHASACARFGAPPGEIGAAVYLIWPALYTNVSAAWRLRRWERVVVDVGGAYFQLVAAAAYTLLFEMTGYAPLKMATLMIGANVIWMLNPVFKFDGYWLLSDALGVTNLSQQPARIGRYVRARLRGDSSAALPWPAGINLFMIAYGVVSIGGWMFFMVFLLPWLWTKHLTSYPALALSLAADVVRDPASVSLDRVRAFLSASFYTFVASLMLWRTMNGLVRGRVNAIRRRFSRPQGESPIAPAANDLASASARQ